MPATIAALTELLLATSRRCDLLPTYEFYPVVRSFGKENVRFYRVYEIDETDSIEDTRLIEAADDATALEQARTAAGVGAAIEVWD